jgi:acetoin utilization protein AcuB
MTFAPVTIGPGDPLGRAMELMREKGYEALPVVENGDVKGVVTAWDLLRVAFPPGDAAVDQPVSEIMSTQVWSISADEIIEEAAFLMTEHDVWALPVINEDNHLVGIITQDDLFRVMVDMMGLHSKGTRITLRVADRQGLLADLTQIVKQAGISIASLATYIPEQRHVGNVVLRVKTTEPAELVKRLRAAGFWVTHVSQVWE